MLKTFKRDRKERNTIEKLQSFMHLWHKNKSRDLMVQKRKKKMRMKKHLLMRILLKTLRRSLKRITSKIKHPLLKRRMIVKKANMMEKQISKKIKKVKSIVSSLKKSNNKQEKVKTMTRPTPLNSIQI